MTGVTHSGTEDSQPREARIVPTGGVALSEERLARLASQWEALQRGLRAMDQLELGETEPATLFVWRQHQP